MPATSFERTFTVAAAPEKCWPVVTDVTRLVSWVSVIDQVEELDPLAKYTAVLADRLGPFKLKADLDVAVSEVTEPEQLRVRAAGEDRQISSRLTIDVLLAMAPVAGGTRLSVTGTYEIAGKVATLGAGMVRQKANKILDEFSKRATDELGSVSA
jgi:uncharacterized protein